MIDRFARLRILSITELLAGKKIAYPRFALDVTHKRAPKARKAAEEQIRLGEGDFDESY